MMKNAKYSLFLRFLGIILFIYVLYRIDIAELIIVFKEMSIGYYLIAILFTILGFLSRTLRWKVLTDSIGIRAPFNDLLKIMAKGLFLGIVTPAKIGEFWRAKYLAEISSTPPGKVFYTAFIDRLMDLLVVGLVIISGSIVFYLKFEYLGGGWEVLALIFVLLIFLALFFLKKLGLQKILKVFTRFFMPASWREKTDTFLNEFDQALVVLRPRLFFKVGSYGLLYYLISIIAYYFVALAVGITIPFWYLFFIVAIVWLVLALPVTILGLGTREATFIYFLSFFSISAPLAVTFSLLTLTCDLVVIGIPGVILFLKQK